MKYKVYFANNPTFGLQEHPEVEEMSLIAEIEARNLDEAFAITQNGVEADCWIDNATSTKFIHPDDNFRSFSVGDAFCDEDGNFHRCELTGWTREKSGAANAYMR